MIDKKGKLFGKVSVIDLFVVGVLVLIGLFGVLSLGNSGGIGIFETPRPVQITVTTTVPTSVNPTRIEGFTAHRIQVGDPVTVQAGNVDWGHVSHVEVVPFIDYHHNTEGEMVASEMTGWYSVTLTTETEGFDFENGIWINGHTFLLGQNQVLLVGDTNIFIHVIDIQID